MASPGEQFHLALLEEKPLQIVGTPNALTAMMAKTIGFRAIYLSGAGVANACFGLPDLGITSLNDVLTEARRITNAVDLPLLVDVDTGFGNIFAIARMVKEMIQAGVAAIHMEDQVADKRCGHRPGKTLVSAHEMVQRLQAAVDARTDSSFVIMARTDALGVESFAECLARVHAYIEAGADMIFLEAVKSLQDYEKIRAEIAKPVLINVTEFGKTPLFSIKVLKDGGVDAALYPLSIFRMMNKSALTALQTIRTQGSQQSIVSDMQTRAALYQLLGYEAYEMKIDKILQGDGHE